MNLPNKLTISRIILVPVFMLLIIPIPDWIVDSSFLSFAHSQLEDINYFIKNYGNYIAAMLFFVAASTDGLDGYIARKRKQVTNFGKFLDPIADKLLVTAALIALVERNDLSSWVAIIIIGREFIITGLRLVAASEGIVIAASKWGKIKTVTQIIAILAALVRGYLVEALHGIPIDKFLMLIAVVTTIYSAYDYIIKNAHVINQDK
ncbi:CDP-diacylglycerol--glycerol-3-phosphate 3-phosphatidyltransferase [Acetivibrio mesophilus]|uniref:CDP-diacylglycerol--glycerol-3-phosphate 3-phosphatidyltransferase n=1 Tax=Acetivibrio mesophilus TaxID=2487273 RepID=A0A4Q0I613_9FIRM|nr:CDP-diacylglycerol--glycerol-3-phosphate 3-phosphatidyltransferase [Acetivibrio mesophilus]ODM25211.1 CDP-diacylglycerol--glycerol-3-phosphate 3-phosphatidyltransferase [Clostridium sp. Bc-iso-3]RXE59771.1 CDP-diacylglycerol--glycerol-3-phosphate 3-phosphatidyltransferase [Acetivibrio mesophilus]HHV29307.1 CDP-diacylglycerol--glycerol-3-phosphate 3-phosphatidyltransferase [Clostridium sp.]